MFQIQGIITNWHHIMFQLFNINKNMKINLTWAKLGVFAPKVPFSDWWWLIVTWSRDSSVKIGDVSCIVFDEPAASISRCADWTKREIGKSSSSSFSGVELKVELGCWAKCIILIKIIITDIYKVHTSIEQHGLLPTLAPFLLQVLLFLAPHPCLTTFLELLWNTRQK